jgi:hypothetical protein
MAELDACYLKGAKFAFYWSENTERTAQQQHTSHQLVLDSGILHELRK